MSGFDQILYSMVRTVLYFHYLTGRNRNLQGLAASIIKLWEKCEIAKIAVKRGVQNTNSVLMSEELQVIDTFSILIMKSLSYITSSRK